MNVKAKIIEYAKMMEKREFINGYEGNISMKYDGKFYITPSQTRKHLLEEDMIAVLDEEGKQIGGNIKASSEMLLHFKAYEVRDDIKAVIHAHTPYLTAHAICNKPIETKAYAEMIALFKKIEVVPYGRPGTPKIAEQLGEYLSRNDVVLLKNHGALSVGVDMEIAFNKLDAAEAIAKALSIADKIGNPVDIEKEEYDYLYNLKF